MTDITYLSAQGVIIITPDVFPHDEEFDFWASLFLPSSCDIGTFEQGADRHQLKVRFKGHDFQLNYEHYSQSIWFEGVDNDAKSRLAELAEALKN